MFGYRSAAARISRFTSTRDLVNSDTVIHTTFGTPREDRHRLVDLVAELLLASEVVVALLDHHDAARTDLGAPRLQHLDALVEEAADLRVDDHVPAGQSGRDLLRGAEEDRVAHHEHVVL